MNRTEIKSAAKRQIQGKIGILFLIAVIIYVIQAAVSSLLSLIPAGGIIGTVVISPAFALSTVRIYLNVVKGDDPTVSDAFSGFDDFWSAFKVKFFVGLYTFLWSILLVIPGIIKAYSYSMAMYVLADNPGKPALECIEESKRMTDGHKMELFVLHLSFIGLILFGIITLGIGFIWVKPHMSAAYANAYNSLKPVEVQAEEPVIEG